MDIMKPVTFAIIGGDLRQRSLADCLAKDGHTVRLFALERLEKPVSDPRITLCTSLGDALADARCIVAPLPICDEMMQITTPFSKERITVTSLLDEAPPTAVLLGGKLPPEVFSLAEAHGIAAFDYLEREEFAVLNAIPTAEGAIRIAMDELSVTLDRTRCLVVGYGRIGKLLAHKLKLLGAEVTVSARKCSDLAWIRAYGYTPIETAALGEQLGGYDVIFNTVPLRLFGDKWLSELDESTICIDLASKPGGFDLDAAARHAVKVIWALSLPGKVAPLTAGAIVGDTVVNILREQEIL